MHRLYVLIPLLSMLACAQTETENGTMRAAILIGAGVVSVVLLILFGKPGAGKKDSAR